MGQQLSFASRAKKKNLRTLLRLGLWAFLSLGLFACNDGGVPKSSSDWDSEEIGIKVDEASYNRVLEILKQDPSENDAGDDEIVEEPQVETQPDSEPLGMGGLEKPPGATDTPQSPPQRKPLSEKDAATVMRFVDEATLQAVIDESKGLKEDGPSSNPLSSAPTESKSGEAPKPLESTAPDLGSADSSAPPTVRRCEGDGVDKELKRYNESVTDGCLYPKIKTASQLFNIKYAFARCIFEKENPNRDRLAHNMNGNGLAQIVNKTMEEINNRWNRQDSLSKLLQYCLAGHSNREDHYLGAVDKFIVPAAYSKADIYNEASQQPPSWRVNPLYRDDSVCLGLMTMGIKVQEARGRRSNKVVSDAELARRYNGSKLQRAYSRAVVSCVGGGISKPAKPVKKKKPIKKKVVKSVTA